MPFPVPLSPPPSCFPYLLTACFSSIPSLSSFYLSSFPAPLLLPYRPAAHLYFPFSLRCTPALHQFLPSLVILTSFALLPFIASRFLRSTNSPVFLPIVSSRFLFISFPGPHSANRPTISGSAALHLQTYGEQSRCLLSLIAPLNKTLPLGF